MEELYNKEFKITISFASYTVDGGSSPRNLLGRLVSIKDGFYKFEDAKEFVGSLKGLTAKRIGDIYIKEDYIISLEEVK